MPTDKRVIPQDKIDLTSSLLVDAHSLKALPFTQDYSSTLCIGKSDQGTSSSAETSDELVLANMIHDLVLYDKRSKASAETSDGLALANIIQNLVLYDTIIADSLLLQTEPGVKEACNLFPDIVKGVYFETRHRQEIGERVYTVVPIWDIGKPPRVIPDKHWSDIKQLESTAKSFMDRMTKVVPNLIPPEFEDEKDEEIQWKVKKLERDAENSFSIYENLPDCCVSSSTGLARTHYYLELARELSVPLSVHPIRSSYVEILASEYQKEYEEYSQKNVSDNKLIENSKQLEEMNKRTELVAYAENIILKGAIEESGAPISLKLTIPPIAELVMNYAAKKKCPIHEAIIEIRQSKNATKFREWCQIYTEASMKGRPGIKEQTELFKDFKNACEIWKNNIKEEVDYKTRTITLEKIPIIGGTLKSLNMDKLSVRDPVLVPKTNFSYFLLLNDLYEFQPKNLY